MTKVLLAIALLMAIMFAEYRFIMTNIEPYYADGYVYVDFMGQTDMYYASPNFELE